MPDPSSRFFSSTYSPESQAIVNRLLCDENGDKAMLVRLDPDGSVHAFGDPMESSPPMSLLDTWNSQEQLEAGVSAGVLDEMPMLTVTSIIQGYFAQHNINLSHMLDGATIPPPPEQSLVYQTVQGVEPGLVLRLDPGSDTPVVFTRTSPPQRLEQNPSPVWKTRGMIVVGGQDGGLEILNIEKMLALAGLGILPVIYLLGATVQGKVVEEVTIVPPEVSHVHTHDPDRDHEPDEPPFDASSADALEEQWAGMDAPEGA